MSFTLHPKLAEDCSMIGDLPLCRVLLMNNRNFPWLILVPMRENIRELYDLAENDYLDVMAEVRRTACQFSRITQAYKINVATLGNQVEQLHIHIIARFKDDCAWPQPVWGSINMPYTPQDLTEKINQFRSALV